MKLAIVLLCVVAAVQARSTAVKVGHHQQSLAALGEKPWVVHLRLAISTSGFLESCTGALIDSSWVLTTAHCVRDVRFIWLRFGAVEVIRPELVLESTNVIRNDDWNPLTQENNIALINVNRVIDLTSNIDVIPLPAANSGLPDRANYCAYGESSPDTAGEFLRCWDVTIVAENQQAVIYEGEDISATEFDTGAPVVGDGVLLGVLSTKGEFRDEAVFIRTSAQVNWITGMTGLDFSRAPAPEQERQEAQDVIIVNDLN
ncbi:transmembrane protease serine 11D-like [Cydia pomonella]|uniref:transmembrane protease serine 11D-like n=1 Tax=Cydia pomonella TaxID=82600 RepID=UPI002ADD655E|nr:transmembrane protease serine 11D-like [Cydia pomonella]